VIKDFLGLSSGGSRVIKTAQQKKRSAQPLFAGNGVSNNNFIQSTLNNTIGNNGNSLMNQGLF
jgi:hypothetical protein